MKKLLFITTFLIFTASYIFTLAWANEYTEEYIRPSGEVEVKDQLVSNDTQTDISSYNTSVKEVNPNADDVFIKLLPERSDLVNSYGLKLFGDEGDMKRLYGNKSFRIKAVVTEYKANSFTAGDILRSLPVVSIKDEQTIGIIIPPFAYFAKKF